MRVEHNIASLTTSTLYHITDLKAFLWKKRSYCDLWRYHDFEYMYNQGHPYDGKEPEIIRIKDTPEDLERYSEILYNLACKDHRGFNTVHDVASIVIRRVMKSPDLGLKVAELSTFYNYTSDNFVLTKGLFVYEIDKDGVSEKAGLMKGDVIVSIQRPDLEKVPSTWKRQHLDYDEVSEYDGMYDEPHSVYRTYKTDTANDVISLMYDVEENEHLILNVIRDGELMDLDMYIPFVPKISTRFEVPKIVVKRIPKFDMDDNEMNLHYDPNDPTDRIYLRMKGGIDINERELFLEIPDTLIGVRFCIDEKGNLVVEYE